MPVWSRVVPRAGRTFAARYSRRSAGVWRVVGGSVATGWRVTASRPVRRSGMASWPRCRRRSAPPSARSRPACSRGGFTAPTSGTSTTASCERTAGACSPGRVAGRARRAVGLVCEHEPWGNPVLDGASKQLQRELRLGRELHVVRASETFSIRPSSLLLSFESVWGETIA